MESTERAIPPLSIDASRISPKSVRRANSPFATVGSTPATVRANNHRSRDIGNALRGRSCDHVSSACFLDPWVNASAASTVPHAGDPVSKGEPSNKDAVIDAGEDDNEGRGAQRGRATTRLAEQGTTAKPGASYRPRAAAILRALEDEAAGLSLGQISQRVDLARSTVQRIVAALEAEKFLIAASPNGRVRLGPTILRLAAAARTDFVAVTRPYLIAAFGRAEGDRRPLGGQAGSPRCSSIR